jgi:hypothetical protein
MCRELLAITDTLDPGCARLALYSSVLLQELHCAEFHLTRHSCEQHPSLLSAQETTGRVLEARALLLKAIEILKPEPQLSSGAKMLELVRKTLSECETWMKDKMLTIPTRVE